jgi:hypothetical protein
MEQENPATELHLARYLAIDPPVDMIYALTQLDDYYNAPLAWKPDERPKKIEQTLFQASKLFDTEDEEPDPKKVLTFDATQSRYVIGLTYRLVLRDTIFTSQQKHNLGVINDRLSGFSLRRTYALLSNYSYADYLNLFLMPYYLRQAGGKVTEEDLIKQANLQVIGPQLKVNPKLRVYANENDFTLRREDLDWLRSTFGDRLTVFPDGGHLGNLHLPEVQEKIVNTLRN